jgi:PAS domain S-box-containing protein
MLKQAREVIRGKHGEEQRERASETLDAAPRAISGALGPRSTEEALAESEQKFRAVFDQAAIGIALGTLDGRCVRANKAACHFIGATEEEVCQLRIQDIVHPEDIELTANVFPRLVAGEIPSYTVERRYVRPDQTIVWGRASVSLVRDGAGRPSYLVGVLVDVSKEKRVEKQRAAFSHLGYRLSGAVSREAAAGIILEIASEVFGLDAGFLHLYSEAKDEIARVLTIDTIGGQRGPVSPQSLSPEPSPMMCRVMKEGGQLINRGTDPTAGPKLLPFGDTERRSTSLMYVPVRSGGAVVGILSVQSYTPWAYSQDDLRLLQTLADLCGDALERIRVTEALDRSHEELERLVRERTAQLEAANQSLRIEMADRKRLERRVLESTEREQQRIGQDLHDGLCQLLAGIKFRAASLEAELRQRDLPQAGELREIEKLISQAIHQGHGLARGLNPVQLPRQGLGTALKALAASVEAAFGVACVCDFTRPVGIADQVAANHLYRIVQEAIHNAIKHGRARTITIRLRKDAGGLALTIKDDGAGLPAETDHEPGMGLQNMRARADMMGASFDIRSGDTGGAEVTCFLPIPSSNQAG